MTTKIIAVSSVAAVLYAQAANSEVSGIVAYAFDTIGYEKGEFHEYNMQAAETLNLSLATMRNRATASRGIQDKYGALIAGYADGLTLESVNHFVTFLKAEMLQAGAFHMHSEDIGNFLAGKTPAHVQRQAAKDKAAEVKATLAATAKAKAEKEQADKAANEADISGTIDAIPAVVPEAGVAVGEGIKSGNESVPTLPMPEVQDNNLITAVLDDAGDISLVVHELCDIATLDAIIGELQATSKRMKKEAKALLKVAA